MKPNCDLCKVSSTSSSPPPPQTSLSGKTKVLAGDDDRGAVKSAKNKYLSHQKHHSKHCSSMADSPPLKPVSNLLAVPAIRTIAPQTAEAAAAVVGHQQQQQQQQQSPYHHLHHHRQFNGFDEYYSAPLLPPSLMVDMMLAAHLLRG